MELDHGTILLLYRVESEEAGSRKNPSVWKVLSCAGIDPCLDVLADCEQGHVLLDGPAHKRLGPAGVELLEGCGKGLVLPLLDVGDLSNLPLLQPHENLVVDSLQELRTPVTVVFELVNLLLDCTWVGELNERQRDYLDRIRSSTSSMVRRIEDVRSLLQLRRSHVPSRGDRPDVAESLARVAAGSRGHSVELGDLPAGVIVSVRTVLLDRAVEALIEWAVQRARCEALRLDVEREGSAKQAWVSVIVAYDGPQPTEQDRQVLLHGSLEDGIQRKSVTKLFGVGIELARSVALSSGGDLTLEVGEAGGCFRLRLPELITIAREWAA